MERIRHYTSGLNWDNIQGSKYLFPRTEPNIPVLSGLFESNPLVDEIITHEKYLVGIPVGMEEKWVEYGLMEHIFEKVGSRSILLELPIVDRKNTFVRDHAHFSPKRFLDLFGFNLIKNDIKTDDKRFIKQLYKYSIESLIRLEDYGGQYEVPEVWCPQKTPLSLLVTL